MSRDVTIDNQGTKIVYLRNGEPIAEANQQEGVQLWSIKTGDPETDFAISQTFTSGQVRTMAWMNIVEDDIRKNLVTGAKALLMNLKEARLICPLTKGSIAPEELVQVMVEIERHLSEG